MDLVQENEFLRLKIRSIVQKLKEKEESCDMTDKSCMNDIRVIVEKEAGATYEEIICRKVDKNFKKEKIMSEWNKIDCNYREKLPKEDCEIWITRVACFTEEPWVQKVNYYAENGYIEWDGTVAWMIATDENKPEPCKHFYMTVQSAR